ncbi:MFS transporter [Variovorax sp. DAIF25]|uniref:MFS transporter n=1 Tax=Variovorax sp. DAIF25 TaxID=3080983 RepID=UPI003D6B601F
MSSSPERSSRPATPPVQLASRHWLALAVLLCGAFLPILDFTIVNLALPSIRQDLHADSGDVQFVISAYAATYAVMLITGGRLGDLYGRRRMFLSGAAGFVVASWVCGFAGSARMLLLGRILQALAAAIMAPQVLATIRVMFAGKAQARALGLYGATFGLANIGGQLLGGLLIAMRPFGLGWQAIFLINVPIGIVAIVGGIFWLEESRSSRAKRLDVRGVLLLSVTLGCVVYPLIEGPTTGWPGWMMLMLASSVVAFVGFIRHETHLSAHGGDPLVELSLFRTRRFSLGAAMGTVFYMLSAFYLTFSVYLQGGLRASPQEAGLATLPFALGFFLSSIASPFIERRLATRTLVYGFVLQIVGFGAVVAGVVLPLFSPLAGGLVPGLACAGLGYGIVMPALIKAVLADVEERHAGLAAGVVMTALQVGAALGVAVVGGIFYAALGAHPDPGAYAHAFSLALACNIALLGVGSILAFLLPVAGARSRRGATPS